MAKAINMPQVGQDIETAVLSEWKVKKGDNIHKGDIIATVESDKAVFEVEAFEDGTILKLCYNEGDEGKVFEPIAFVGKAGEAVEETGGTTESAKPISPPETDLQKEYTDVWTPPVSKIKASPSARRTARQYDIDLKELCGTGPDGRIIKRDILIAAEAKKKQPFVSLPSNREEPLSSVPPSPPVPEQDKVVPFNKMRQSVADRLCQSWRTIPHFYLSTDCDLTSALAWRQAFNISSEFKISVNDLIIKACCVALKNYPNMNAHIDSHHMVLKNDINIGVAVSIEDGLIVPVIPRADTLDITEIARSSKDITAAARRGVIKSAEPGTFTVSNLGMHDIKSFQPIINPPEAGILGVGTAEKKIVMHANGTTGPRDILKLTLACDHRAVDGVYAANFLNVIKSFLEHFNL